MANPGSTLVIATGETIKASGYNELRQAYNSELARRKQIPDGPLSSQNIPAVLYLGADDEIVGNPIKPYRDALINIRQIKPLVNQQYTDTDQYIYASDMEQLYTIVNNLKSYVIGDATDLTPISWKNASDHSQGYASDEQNSGCKGACTGVCHGTCYSSSATGTTCNGCAASCSGGCANGCGGGCSAGCSGSCAWGCGNGCATGCNASCTVACGGTCSTWCTTACTTGCGAGCGSNCNSSCSGGCSSTCNTNCSKACFGCTGACYSSCSGCTSTCGSGCGSSCEGTAQFSP